MPLDRNDLGGVNDMDKSALERAKKSDLVTLPSNVQGTNCYNCRWIGSPKKAYGAMCKNPKVQQYVNARMCCALWDAKGVYRPFKQEEEYK